MAQQVLSITQVNEYIRRIMDADSLLGSVAVRGEISNYKVYPSGHHYFTLKDDDASLKCVMFRSSAVRIKFRPENGMRIIAMGKISVFPRDGAYQLYCSAMALDGVGDLHTAFEQLKAKLAQQGLFDPSHKKTLPRYPARIGIITSSAGAAVHDMLRILRKRYPLTQVKILPVRVQGEEAPGEIASAIAYANHFKLADLLIVGRGGGSIEDLWAFNDEQVARSIFDSEIPIISAVGHEPDVTISDFVADLRAATPSNGAELAVPDQDALRQSLDATLSAMAASVEKQVKNAKRQLDMLSASAVLKSPDAYILQKCKSLELLTSRLRGAGDKLLSNYKHRFISNAAKLDALSPLKVLYRGYAMVQTDDGNAVRSAKGIAVGDNVKVFLSDGSFKANVTDVKESICESRE